LVFPVAFWISGSYEESVASKGVSLGV
jgi:hypothetical protein